MWPNDPLRQALLEIYTSIVLGTMYNDFNTHFDRLLEIRVIHTVLNANPSAFICFTIVLGMNFFFSVSFKNTLFIAVPAALSAETNSTTLSAAVFVFVVLRTNATRYE